ncbi:vWA domain-containing protein [Kocuria sabuli]|uniref:vWA domain-containing protein n=1 Tax=Kocuria sabuli TaxID=3071448 RepID=UPI0034D3DCC5
MYDFAQVPFDANEFVENPEPRCPCLLLLDTSGSMSGRAIEELNAGLQTFASELTSDGLAAKRVEVAVVSFGPVKLESNFVSAEHFSAPALKAGGRTPMGEAITLGLSLTEERKQIYREQGISYYRPWIFLITDGAPTDDWREAASRVRGGEMTRSFSFFAVGTDDANFDVLSQISSRQPLKLRGLEFSTMFTWLSNSMGSVSRSQPDQEVALTNPAAPDGWAVV